MNATPMMAAMSRTIELFRLIAESPVFVGPLPHAQKKRPIPLTCKAVLMVLAAHEGQVIGNVAIAERCGCSENAVMYALHAMERDGYITRKQVWLRANSYTIVRERFTPATCPLHPHPLPQTEDRRKQLAANAARARRRRAARREYQRQYQAKWRSENLERSRQRNREYMRRMRSKAI